MQWILIFHLFLFILASSNQPREIKLLGFEFAEKKPCPVQHLQGSWYQRAG
jgi:hypothetical protein